MGAHQLIFTSLRDDRHAVAFPWLIQRMDETEAKRLLDDGCGDGVFAWMTLGLRREQA